MDRRQGRRDGIAQEWEVLVSNFGRVQKSMLALFLSQVHSIFNATLFLDLFLAFISDPILSSSAWSLLIPGLCSGSTQTCHIQLCNGRNGLAIYHLRPWSVTILLPLILNAVRRYRKLKIPIQTWDWRILQVAKYGGQPNNKRDWSCPRENTAALTSLCTIRRAVGDGIQCSPSRPANGPIMHPLHLCLAAATVNNWTVPR